MAALEQGDTAHLAPPFRTTLKLLVVDDTAANHHMMKGVKIYPCDAISQCLSSQYAQARAYNDYEVHTPYLRVHLRKKIRHPQHTTSRARAREPLPTSELPIRSSLTTSTKKQNAAEKPPYKKLTTPPPTTHRYSHSTRPPPTEAHKPPT